MPETWDCADGGRTEQTEPIVGNKAIEDAAIRFVIDEERRFRREAHDTRHRGARGDVESAGRIIEVKGLGKWLRTQRLLNVTGPQLGDAGNPDHCVYIVENITQRDRSKFEIRVLHGEDLQRVFAGAKPHRYKGGATQGRLQEAAIASLRSRKRRS